MICQAVPFAESAILFLDSGHKQKSHASLHPFVTALSHISASALPVPASELCSYITLDIGDYHNPFQKKSAHKKAHVL